MSNVIIEQNKRLSDSVIWQTQREYYATRGVQAWENDVPSFVTSNPFIARQYAMMAAYFMRDWLVHHPAHQDQPFYLMELGAGHAKFSFYMVKFLEELLQKDDIQFCYIISDFAIGNVQFWQENPVFSRLLEEGKLDFCQYDLENSEHIFLEQQQRRLEIGDLANPFIVVANYIFDSIPQDVFRVQDGDIYESLLTTETEESNTKDGKLIDWNHIHTHYGLGNKTADWYEDQDFNNIVTSYKNQLKNTSFLFPIASFKAIKKLLKFTDNRLLLLSSDNGSCNLVELEGLADPYISFHGSISMQVNYHAIGQYFQLKSGGALLAQPHTGLKTAVFYVGLPPEKLPNFMQFAREVIERDTPCDYFNYHRHMSQTKDRATLAMLVSYLLKGAYDPYCLSKVSARVREVIQDAKHESILALQEALPKIAENYYFMPGVADSLFDIAVVYHSLSDYKNALYYYLESEQYFGEHFNLFYNVAICYYFLDENENARLYFNKAKVLDPEASAVDEWLNRLD